MIEIRRERLIDATPEELWPLVSEPARLPDWFTFAERGELLEGLGLDVNGLCAAVRRALGRDVGERVRSAAVAGR
jgi:hypothetical protein